MYGHAPQDIEKFEQMGFVMSGSRRKSKQQAEDASKKTGLILQKEDKALRETELVARFKEMIQERKGNI
jgi:NF-kappa-B-activating protein C-terminal domain